MLTTRSSLRRFQKRNDDLYLVANGRNYGPPEMLEKVLRHVTYVLKSVRKRRHEKIEYHLCMALSWSLGILNRFHVDLSKEMWKRFPGLCPYCIVAPCDCRRRRKERRSLSGIRRGRKPVSLQDWQKMFARIYHNRLLNSTLHLAEEIGEVSEALRVFLSMHSEGSFIKTVEEIVDAVTNILGVANCLRIDMAAGMVRYFADSCPGCKKFPCACGFVPEA